MGRDGDSTVGGAPAPTATFEELMVELETITATLAAGDLGIEAAADLYQRAEELHALASERLDQVKARVDGLTAPSGERDEKGGLPGTG